LFAIPWSIGAVIDTDGREKFDQFYRMLLLGKIENCAAPEILGSKRVPFPDNGQVYDYFYDVGSSLYDRQTYFILTLDSAPILQERCNAVAPSGVII
jgi:Dynein heavy chain AAA lid domain